MNMTHGKHASDTQIITSSAALMSWGLVQYSDRIHRAQEQTREDLIWLKVSSRRARMVGRSLGFVSMISLTKNTTSRAELLLVSPCISGVDLHMCTGCFSSPSG